MMKARIQWTLGLVTIVGLVGVGLFAQDTRSGLPASRSTLDDLVAEVRGLRPRSIRRRAPPSGRSS